MTEMRDINETPTNQEPRDKEPGSNCLVKDYDSSSSSSGSDSASVSDGHNLPDKDVPKILPMTSPLSSKPSKTSKKASQKHLRRRSHSSSPSSSSSSSGSKRHRHSSSRERHNRYSSRRQTTKRRSHSRSRSRDRRRKNSSPYSRRRDNRRRSRSRSSYRHRRRSRSSSRRGSTRRHDRHRHSPRRRRSDTKERSNSSAYRSNRRSYKNNSWDKRNHARTSNSTNSLTATSQGQAANNSLSMPPSSNSSSSLSQSVAKAAALALSLSQQGGPKLTNSEVLARMQAQHEARMREAVAQAEAVTGVTLPRYYNPAAINPLKMAEQEQKKRLLWGNKGKVSDEETNAKKALWSRSSMMASGGDPQAAQKFRSLMGISKDGKQDDASGEVPTVSGIIDPNEWHKRLEQEYEFARGQTHEHRGSGLGYSQQACIDPNLYIGDKVPASHSK